MTSPRWLLRPLLGAGLASLVSTGALAVIPAGYRGTPYKAPQAIPGRVELADLDKGGEGVTYHADHRRVNAKAEGYSPLSGDDYRPTETDLPDICRTNTNPPPDTWDKAGGLPYPSAALEHWYYMGLAHAVDWVKVTVDVKKAGKYWLSSNWASPNGTMRFQIYFNDGSAPAAAGDTKLDGVMKADVNLGAGTGDYHIWKAYPHFAMVDLSEGLQVMTFHLRTDHLQYGFIQFDPVDGTDGGAVDAAGATDAGAAGAAGTDGAAGTTGSAGTTGAAGTTGSAGTTGAAGVPGGAAGTGSNAGGAGTGSTAGVSGAAGVPAGAAAGTGGGAAGTGAPRANGDSGCACSTGGAAGGGSLSLLLALALVVRRRRPAR